MGFFDNVKKAMDSAKEGYADAADAAKTGLAQAKEQLDTARAGFAEAAAQSRAAQEEFERNRPIIDPTPQSEVDRINAGTGPGIAVVSGNRNNLESGESVYRTNAQIGVRMRLANGQLGDASWHKLWTSSAVIRALLPGTEIPAEVDRATGTVTALDQKAIAASLKSRRKGGGTGW
jgi:hypothetical protein